MMRLFVFLFLYLSLHVNATTLHLATSSNPARLNPILATDSSSAEITGFLFNGLVKYDKDSKEIIGDLAKKFYFKNNKTLVFELKQNVLWHDGKKFTANDVLFTYKTLISVNASFNTHPTGTGAYKLKQLEYSKNIELAAFDKYFEGRAKIDTISFHVIPDAMTRFLMLQSGQLDVGSVEPFVYERQLKKEFFNTFNIYEKISLSYTYLGFNLRKKKFQNPKVRHALSLAINRQELIDILFLKHAKVCTGPFLHPSLCSRNPAVPVKKSRSSCETARNGVAGIFKYGGFPA